MKLQLDEKWRIESDTYSWVLIFQETREKKKKETKEKEEFEYVDNWYYPKLSQALRTYKQESLKTTETIEQLLLKLESIDNKIDEIKNDIWTKNINNK